MDVNNLDFERQFDYENGFYLTAPVNRISKFATHLELFRRVQDLAGDIVECGVFKGISLSRFIKFRAMYGNPFSKKIIAFDTFGEFPEAGYEPDQAQRDRFVTEAGSQSISVDSLNAVLDRLGLNQNIELIEGDLNQTAQRYIEACAQLRISLLHIDVDLYEPTRSALEAFYPRVVNGGIVILDDYGAFPGANKAIDEYLFPLGAKVRKLPYSHAISYVVKEEMAHD